jgi:hypothetical protein
VQDIFKTTGAAVLLPLDSSDLIVVRGNERGLKSAIEMILKNQESCHLFEIDLSTVINENALLYFRYISQKLQPEISKLEKDFECSIFSKPDSMVFEIQAKSPKGMEKAKAEFTKFCKQLQQKYSLVLMSLDRGIHLGSKFVSNPEWNSRVIDVLLPPNKSLDVILVLTRGENSELVTQIKEFLEREHLKTSSLVSQTISIERKYHGKLIGQGGSALNELLAPFDGDVSIKFGDSTDILIKGSETQVQDVIKQITDQVTAWKKFDSLVGFMETLKVPTGFATKLVGTGKELGWLFKSLRDLHSKEPIKFLPNEKQFEKEFETNQKIQNLQIDVEADQISIKGPKTLVGLVKSILKKKLTVLENSLDISFNIFNEISTAAKELIKDYDDEEKRKFIKQLIGKDGKQVKKVLDDNHSFAHFSKDGEDSGQVNVHGDKSGVKIVKKSFVDFVNEKVLGF